MSIKELRNKERRSLKAVMQGGVARGEKRRRDTRMKSFVKVCHGNSNSTRRQAYRHKSTSSPELLMLYRITTTIN